MKKILVLLFTIFLAGCCKEGLDGKASLTAYPKHHGTPIKGCIMYLKFGAKELPSNPTTDYDEKIIGNPGDAFIKVPEIKCGNYFLYIIGYDSSISQTVRGGVALKIKYGERKDDHLIDVSVTE